MAKVDKESRLARGKRENDERLMYVTDAFLYHVDGRQEQWEKYAEDMRFFVGEQWDEEDRELVEKQNKPALVYNHVQRQINLLTGYERTERREIMAKPKGTEDVLKAHIVSGAIKSFNQSSNSDYEWTEGSENCLIMGEGIMGMPYDHEKGRYQIKSELPFNHVPDRDCMDRTWTDSTIHFRFRWYSKNDIRRMFPDKEDVIDEIRPCAYYGFTEGGKVDIDRQLGYDVEYGPKSKSKDAQKRWSEFYDEKIKRWRVIECYERVLRKVSVVMARDEEGSERLHAEVPYIIDTKGEIVENKAGIAEVVGEMQNYRMDKKKMYRWRLTVFAGDVLLNDGFTKYPRLPFLPLYAYMKSDGEKTYIWGWVRKLADPQTVYNKLKSQLLHMLNKSAGSVILMTSALLKGVGEERMREALTNFNDVVEINAETLKEGEGFVQLKTEKPPSEFFQMLEDGRAELVEIGDLDAQAMLGMGTKGDPSGYALDIKQRQGAIKISTPFDNIREARRMFYEELVWPLIRGSNMKDVVRKELIPGLPGSFSGAGIPINMKPSEMSEEDLAAMTEFMSQEDIDELVTLDEVFNPLSDLNVDIVFDDTQMTDTERERTLTMLLNMARDYGPEMIPLDLILEFTDNPVRSKIMLHLQSLREQAEQSEQAG